MILLALAGCAHTLGRSTVHYGPPEPLPIVRTAVDSRWYVPIEVEGLGLWAFFVDTGYSFSTCDDGLIEALGLETHGRSVLRGELGRVRTTKAQLPQLQLGGHTLDGVVCQVRDLDRTSSIRDTREVRIAGVLGMDVLRPFVVEMDPEQGRIHLRDPNEAEPLDETDPQVVRVRRERIFGMRAQLPITLNGRQVWPVVDTGASGTHLDGDRLDLEPTRVREDVRVRGSGGGGSAVQTVVYYEVTDLVLGGMNPGPLVVTGRSGGVGAGLLGLNLLSNYVATYDFGRGLAKFESVLPRRLPTWSEWRSAAYPPQGTRLKAPQSEALE